MRILMRLSEFIHPDMSEDRSGQGRPLVRAQRPVCTANQRPAGRVTCGTAAPPEKKQKQNKNWINRRRSRARREVVGTSCLRSIGKFTPDRHKRGDATAHKPNELQWKGLERTSQEPRSAETKKAKCKPTTGPVAAPLSSVSAEIIWKVVQGFI